MEEFGFSGDEELEGMLWLEVVGPSSAFCSSEWGHQRNQTQKYPLRGVTGVFSSPVANFLVRVDLSKRRSFSGAQFENTASFAALRK